MESLTVEGMRGTCSMCLAVCVQTFLVERADEVGMCSTCIARTYPRRCNGCGTVQS